MAISANVLRELHRLHKQVSDLRERLGRGPKQVRAGEAAVKQFEMEYTAGKEALTKTRVAADEKQLQLKQREDRIKDLQAKLNASNSNKEYQALREQIAADEQANSVLSDEILEMLEKIDEQRDHLRTLEENVAKAKAELDKTRQRAEAQREGLESELGRVMDELRTAEKGLPIDFKTDYDRITKARGEEALAPVEGESCGGCFQILSPQTIEDLYASKPVFCKSCGCLLYMPENRSAR